MNSRPRKDTSYFREEDGAKMIEIAPHVYVNEQAARALGVAFAALPADPLPAAEGADG